MPKHFLPKAVSFDMETAKNMTERHTPSRFNIRSLRNCLPIFTILMFIGGGTFLGFSLTVVPESHVGYYIPSRGCGSECDIEIYETGTYMNIPWHGGTFSIVDVSGRNLTIGSYVNDRTKTVLCEYTVKDIKAYVTSISKFDNSVSRFETDVAREVGTRIEDISNNTVYSTRGLDFTAVYVV